MKPTTKAKKRARLRRKLRRFLPPAVGALALLLVVLLVFPQRIERDAKPSPAAAAAVGTPAALTPAPAPEPTAAPTPEAKPAVQPALLSSKSIYYPFDRELFTADARGRITYSGEGYRCLTGIDVSEHQYGIDWEKVAADGIDFAIIRTGYRGYTSGGLYEDKYFRANMEGALKAGLKVGVYFFSQATSRREAHEEAAYVLEQIRDYDVTLPVVFDMEILGYDYRTYNMTRRTLYGVTQAFCDDVRAAGYEPMIYMTQYLGYQKYTLRELTDYGFWFAEYYVDYPSFVYDIDIWQYSDTGSVAGISGNVDMDVYLIRE